MAVPPPAPPSKADLRRTLRARRAAFVDALRPEERLAAERVLGAHLARALAPGSAVAACLGHGREPALAPALVALAEAGVVLALPVMIDRAGAMRFARWRPGEALVPGPTGIAEPAADAPDLVPDVILAPLIGFDRGGGRLGQGGGYYDRAFARIPGARRIGIGWSVQEAAALPLDAWDSRLHAIATEAAWIRVD